MIPIISKNKKGFRLSLVDISVFLVAIILMLNIGKIIKIPNELNVFTYGLIPYVVLNFFLFCNVFRVRTKFELFWLFCSVVNLVTLILLNINLIYYFFIQSFFTIFVIILEIRKEDYHGIFAKK